MNKEIAADMGVDERSIKRHRARCLVRLQARTLPELARLAQATGFAPLAPR